MQITPRYDGAAVINVDAVVRSPSTALVRYRARLAQSLRELTAGEWDTPSRCGGWTVQDVVEHLAGVNRFWSLSPEADMTTLKRRPAHADTLARWAWIAVALTPAGWVLGIVLVFLSGEGEARGIGPVTDRKAHV